jgi:hypothetical protein
VDKAQFRLDFPEFADVVKYPDGMLTTWSAIAEKLLIASRWADLLTIGVMLYTAHQLVLARGNSNQSAAGGIPGSGTGLKSSKSVGGVSVSYDTSSVIEQDAGFYNLTTYGQQFYRLMMVVGMGGYQL